MKIFIQQSGGDYWLRGRGWVRGRDSATVFRGVVEAIDCCIESVSGNVDIVLEFPSAQPDVRFHHKFRALPR